MLIEERTQILEIWQQSGRPAIPLRQGEICRDLEKLLSCPNIRDSDIQAISAWAQNKGVEVIEKGHCKHGEFILAEGCHQCMEEARLEREKVGKVDMAEEKPKMVSEPSTNTHTNSGKEGHALEVLALCDRIRLGNEKLFKVLRQIREIADDKEEWSRQMDQWKEAQEKLHSLNLELQAKGFHDCLYLENGKKTRSCLDNPDGSWCQVCPCDPNNPYVEKELMGLPSPGKGKGV